MLLEIDHNSKLQADLLRFIQHLDRIQVATYEYLSVVWIYEKRGQEHGNVQLLCKALRGKVVVGFVANRYGKLMGRRYELYYYVTVINKKNINKII